MAIPAPVAEVITPTLTINGGTLASFDHCEGAKHHSPTPLILHKVSLRSNFDGGEGPQATLCGVCADNLRVFQFLIRQNSGVIAWDVQRCFGNRIRDLAFRGWREYQIHQPEQDGDEELDG